MKLRGRVATTAVPVADGDVTPTIHEALKDCELLAAEHLADTGYTDAELLVVSRREYGVDLIGPTPPGYGWQALAGGGFTAADFAIDWEGRRATCPEGRASSGWTHAVERDHTEVVHIKFSRRDCKPCPARERCTRAARRSLTIRAREPFEALKAARAREATEEYRADYARRAGVEGTISQGCGPARCGARATSAALHRPREDAPPAPGDGDQHLARSRLARGGTSGRDQDVRLRQADRRGRPGLTFRQQDQGRGQVTVPPSPRRTSTATVGPKWWRPGEPAA
jgi:hypothetical protein